jgi:hypothetical protein
LQFAELTDAPASRAWTTALAGCAQENLALAAHVQYGRIRPTQ